jgi:methylenetetrahydrofolate reductase (NADPH)
MSTPADPLVEWVRRPRFEVIPLEGVEEEVLSHVPKQLTVAVSASPTRGLEPTLALCERLAANGYRTVPHLASPPDRRPRAPARRAREGARRRRAGSVRDRG